MLGLLFVSPWLLGFVIFTLYPTVASFYFSLCDYRVLTPPRFIGFGNYASMLHDTDFFWRSVLNTLFMFIELPLALAVSLGIALLLNQKLKGIAFFRALYYLPAVIPTVASAMLWVWMLNPEYGIINDLLARTHVAGLLAAAHVQPQGWLSDPKWSKPAFILLDLWGVGGGVIIYLAGLQGVPQHLYEASQIDGASLWQQFRHVTLPMLSPVIFFNLIMGVIGTFQYFTQTFVMTNGGPANSTLFYALYLFQNAFQFFRMGEACAMAWILFALSVGATWLVFKTSMRWVYYEGELK